LKKSIPDLRIPDYRTPSSNYTRSGYPRIIPSFHRKLLYRKDERADQLVKYYLSFSQKERPISDYPTSLPTSALPTVFE